MNTDLSIHPRATGDGKISHTNKTKNKDVTKRKVAAIEAHLERHPRDSFSQRHKQMLEGTL